MRYFFHIDCEVVIDHYTEGETDRVNNFHWKTEMIAADDDDLKTVLLKFIETELFYNNGNIDHIQVDEEKSNRFCYSFHIRNKEDITTNNISPELRKQWEAGIFILYTANFDVYMYKQAPVDLLSIEKINTF